MPRLVLALITLVFPLLLEAAPVTCPRRARAVIDLGSGSVKLTVAEVETCTERNRLIRIISDKHSHALALEAGKTTGGEIPGALQEQALTLLKQLRDEALKEAKAAGFNEIDLTVIATHAYRTASNQAQFQKRIEAAGFPIQALNQKEEAEAGLFAVQAQGLPAGCDPNSMLVWDIGGGSMQLVRGPNQTTPTPRVEGFNMGAEGFKSALLEKFKPVKSACTANEKTPNPIGKAQSEAVRTFARDTSQRLLRATLKTALRATCVVGIGGVHGKAVSAQIEKSWPKIKECVCKDSIRACTLTKQMYHKVQLECLARHLSEKSDCDGEIQGPYATTAVTNLYFVLGWMDRLGIERVHTRAVSITHYLALDRDKLKFVKVTAPRTSSL